MATEHCWDGVICWKPWTPPSGMVSEGTTSDMFHNQSNVTLFIYLPKVSNLPFTIHKIKY